jgi:cytochrome bd ubiquinol oxidase subunit I
VPFTLAAIVTPIQMALGDGLARSVFQKQPDKFAAIEIVWTTGPDKPEVILGRLNQDTGEISGGLPIPGLASLLSGFHVDTVINGLSTIPRDQQPPANIVHWAWDGMVFGGSALALLATWFALYWIVRRRLPGTAWFYRFAAVAGVLSIFCVECGWVVTEVGRQPWIVYNIMTTASAVTTAGIVRSFFAIILLLYAAIGVVTVLILRTMSHRWTTGEASGPAIPYGPVVESSRTEEAAPVAAPGGSRSSDE